MGKVTSLVMTCKDKPFLLPALKYFANKCDRDGEGEWIYNRLGIFAKGDYSASILRTPIHRDSIDPLRGDILATVADHARARIS